jgi:potassium large conductance calcium-activated channel subfamily M alpha protein 1
MVGAANLSAAAAPLTAEQLCLQDRHWYAFLCSSLITFFVGLLLVLTWRIFAWLCCQPKTAAKPNGPQKQNPDGSVKGPETEIGWVTEAKDWAGELISGQTTTGRILVCFAVDRRAFIAWI